MRHSDLVPPEPIYRPRRKLEYSNLTRPFRVIEVENERETAKTCLELELQKLLAEKDNGMNLGLCD